jgi:PPE-repeat protein
VFSGVTRPLQQNHRDSKLGRHRELSCGDTGQYNRIALTSNGFRAIAGWDAPPADGLVTAKTASDSGSGSLGFAGTVSKASEQAAGLAALPSDDFGGGPSLPMLPHTWTQGERTDPR